MAKKEAPLEYLRQFIPDPSAPLILEYLNHYKVHLTITRERKSVLGDYRHSGWGSNHRISVNGSLNKYEFLITLLHELAHLLTFELHKNRVEPHGKEWKAQYSRLLVDFVQHKIFPADIEKALQKSILNPAATANGETDLLLVLRKYDAPRRPGLLPVEEVPEGALFQTENGRVFKKGPRRRKRFECVELKTGLRYTFSPISEVFILPAS